MELSRRTLLLGGVGGAGLFTAVPIDPPPAVTSFLAGGHTREYWNEHTLPAFRFLAVRLSG